jgi:hypothetical protein
MDGMSKPTDDTLSRHAREAAGVIARKLNRGDFTAEMIEAEIERHMRPVFEGMESKLTTAKEAANTCYEGMKLQNKRAEKAETELSKQEEKIWLEVRELLNIDKDVALDVVKNFLRSLR